MAVLLIADIANGELNVDSTAKALTAAKQMGDVTVLCASASSSAAAEAAAKLDGVAKVLAADDDDLHHEIKRERGELHGRVR